MVFKYYLRFLPSSHLVELAGEGHHEEAELVHDSDGQGNQQEVLISWYRRPHYISGNSCYSKHKAQGERKRSIKQTKHPPQTSTCTCYVNIKFKCLAATTVHTSCHHSNLGAPNQINVEKLGIHACLVTCLHHYFAVVVAISNAPP